MVFKKGEAACPNGPAVYYNEAFLDKLADKLLEWIDKPTSCWFEAFCLENKVDYQTFHDFQHRSEKFKKAYKMAKTWQKQKLIEGGLLGKFNPKITSLLLSHCYNITEKQKIEHEGAQPVEVVHYGKKEPKKWESNSQ